MDDVRAAEHRLAELEWQREQLQCTQSEARLRLKIKRSEVGRRGRPELRRQAATDPDVQLLCELDTDLRNISRAIRELREWLG